MAEGIHVGDVGTVLTFSVLADGSALDLSSATTKDLIFDGPGSNYNFTKTLTFVNDGTDGLVKYLTEADTFPTAGDWTMQVYVELPSGKWYSSTAKVLVLAPLETS